MVERAIGRAAGRINLPGFDEGLGLTIGGGAVHIGTGGAAVEVPDDAGGFRPASQTDLYLVMRLVGQADNIHYGVRPLVARDMRTPLALDLNTAFDCLKGCAKPIGISFADPAHVAQTAGLFDLALGRDEGFRHHPFCTGIIVHAVSPLRYATDGVQIMRAAVDAGIPLQTCPAAQAEATSPATLAGTLAQGLAETLAGLMIADMIKPGFPTIFAFMPFISDLRTGAMTGGSGEAAVANAAAAQLCCIWVCPAPCQRG